MIDAPPAEPPGAATLAVSEDDSAIPLAAGRSAWTARVSVRSKITPGRPMELGVDTASLYFFDPDSALAISCREGLTR